MDVIFTRKILPYTSALILSLVPIGYVHATPPHEYPAMVHAVLGKSDHHRLTTWLSQRQQQTDSLATISTDTGEFASGYHGFVRYTNPSLCLMAARTAEAFVFRSLPAQAYRDSLALQPLRDTEPDSAVTVARTCARQLSGTPATPDALMAWFSLALVARNDTLAQRALTRLIALAKTPEDRNDIRLRAMAAFLKLPSGFAAVAAPPDLQAALVVRDQLDRGEDSSVVVRMNAAQVWLSWYRMTHDTAHSRDEALRIIALWQHVPTKILSDRKTDLGPLHDSYSVLMVLAEATQATGQSQPRSQSPALLAVAERARADYGRLIGWNPFRDNSSVPVLQVPLRDLVAYFAPSQGVFTAYDIRVPQLHADFWFPVSGAQAPRSAHGKIALWLELDPVCYDYRLDWEPYPWCWNHKADVIRDWVQRYGPAGLDVTVVVETRGGSLWEGLVPPQREAERARWYVQDYLHLPVNVAVQEVHFHELPPPDGRRERDGFQLSEDVQIDRRPSWIRRMVPTIDSASMNSASNIDFRASYEVPRSGVVLIDQTGKLLFADAWFGAIGDEVESQLTTVLQQNLGGASSRPRP